MVIQVIYTYHWFLDVWIFFSLSFLLFFSPPLQHPVCIVGLLKILKDKHWEGGHEHCTHA